MDEAVLYARLMDLADALGLEVRTAPVAPPGGTCRIRDRLVVMLSSDATIDEIDTIRVSASTTNHTPSAHAAGIGVNAKNTPTLAATPLPP